LRRKTSIRTSNLAADDIEAYRATASMVIVAEEFES
jgi:hypothetical protein